LQAEIDEFGQDFIWFLPSRLYPVQAFQGRFSRRGAALTETTVSPAAASAIRGIGWVTLHQYQIGNGGRSDRPLTRLTRAVPLLGE
jgi:hypothetical protein